MRTFSSRTRSVLAILDEIAMMTLAMLSGIMLFMELFLRLPPAQLLRMEHIDLIVALIFLTEFTIRLRISKDKLKFLKKYWWELLAAIPISNPITQALRFIRLLRFFHVTYQIYLFWTKFNTAPEYEIT